MSDFEAQALSGGTTRVSISSAREEAMQAFPEAHKVHTGVSREDGSGQFASHQLSTPGLAGTGGSVMATLMNNAGGKRIDSTSTVDIGGIRTSLRVATETGYLVETGPGQYADAPQVQGQQEQAQAADASTLPELASKAAEEDWAADIADIPQHAYDSAVAVGVAAVLDETGAGWEKAATILAQSTGMNPKAAAEYVDAGYSFFEGQVATMAEGLGIDASQREAFYDHMRSAHPRELQQATQQLVTLRRLDGFRELAVAFKVQAGNGQLAMWQKAGFDAHVDRTTGEVMVTRDGGQPVRARDLR